MYQHPSADPSWSIFTHRKPLYVCKWFCVITPVVCMPRQHMTCGRPHESARLLDSAPSGGTKLNGRGSRSCCSATSIFEISFENSTSTWAGFSTKPHTIEITPLTILLGRRPQKPQNLCLISHFSTTPYAFRGFFFLPSCRKEVAAAL